MKKIIMVLFVLAFVGFISGNAFAAEDWAYNSGEDAYTTTAGIQASGDTEIGGDVAVDGDVSIGSTSGTLYLADFASLMALQYYDPAVGLIIDDETYFTEIGLWGSGIFGLSGDDYLMILSPEVSWFKGPFAINTRYEESGVEFKLATVGTAGSGTISSSGTAVTGTGTSFTTEIEIGDEIGDRDIPARKVVAIASDTSLTVDSAFDDSLSNQSYTISTVSMTVDSSGDLALHGGISSPNDINMTSDGDININADGDICIGSCN